jgi:hypothetical protein
MASHNPISRITAYHSTRAIKASRSGQKGMDDWRQIDRITPENSRTVTSNRDYSAMMNGPSQGRKRNAEDAKDNPNRPQGVGREYSAYIVLRSTHDGAIIFGVSRLSRRKKSDRYLIEIQRQSSPRVR